MRIPGFRKFHLIALGAIVSSPALAGTVYDVDLLNATASGIVSFEVARAGSNRFHRVTFVTSQLQGGGEAATVKIRQGDEGCRRDLRIGLADGRTIVRRGFDFCTQLSETVQSLRAQRDLSEADESR